MHATVGRKQEAVPEQSSGGRKQAVAESEQLSAFDREASSVIAQPSSVVHPQSFGLLALIVIVAFALLALLTLAWVQRQAPPLENGLAPAFELTTFDGQTIKLTDLRGKAVVMNFWASWCIPCRDEAPALQATWEKYREQGLMVIGVDYVDTEPEAKKFMQEFGVTYPSGPDVGTRISQSYKITGVPETYFITRDGKLLSGKDATGRAYANWIGAISPNALEERVQKLLAP